MSTLFIIENESVMLKNDKSVTDIAFNINVISFVTVVMHCDR